jgi:tRNA (guanine37-N1)-methyltransferase
MRVDVITLFPEMFSVLTQWSISARAIQRGLLELFTWNPREATSDRHRTVDDRPYGGGPGMVMKVQPLRDTLIRAKQAAGNTQGVTIYLTPQGRLLDQTAVKKLATMSHLILLTGRYEGIDERLITSQVDEEWSIGDYVLSGGELAAMVVIDAVTRLLPGALGDPASAQQDSFMDGLLDYPHYTRPEHIDGISVPQVLLGGDHAAIAQWRLREALGRTWLRRPDLLAKLDLTATQQALLQDFIQEHQQNQKRTDIDRYASDV